MKNVLLLIALLLSFAWAPQAQSQDANVACCTAEGSGGGTGGPKMCAGPDENGNFPSQLCAVVDGKTRCCEPNPNDNSCDGGQGARYDKAYNDLLVK